ncbi:hypothetical protein KIN20_032398 [Parelaphostrongylus tenuis]|uniref:Uncharacterized protein n=1 Tax=Parelaphostrongylus tenuis TaxID=148309 RepID=A0AAD5WIG6_PARTN|nr:hypothetical protein KIN20_032398 [Parelaphostrongylus tenuis]
MMSAAGSAGMRYRRNNAASKPHVKKRRSGSVSIVDSDSKSLLPPPAPLFASKSSTLLTVPDSAIRKRSGSAPALKAVTLAALWNLRKDQVRALRMTWERLCAPPRSNCKGIVNLVERVWEKLDRKDSSVRNIFYNAAFVETMHDRCERRRSKASIATLRDHTHFFVSLVSQVVQSLDVNPENILNHIDTIGRNHAFLMQYGFRSQHWEKIGEYFIDIVVIQDCVRGYPEACRAWTILVAALVDRLRAAPRRGSHVSLTSSQNSINGSRLSVSSLELRRKSGTVSINGSQNSVPDATESDLAEWSLRKSGHGTPESLPDMEMTSLEKALPHNRSSNPMLTSII